MQGCFPIEGRAATNIKSDLKTGGLEIQIANPVGMPVILLLL